MPKSKEEKPAILNKIFSNHRGLIITLILAFFYLATRLYHLVNFPIFCDEAIYIRWSQVIKSLPSLWWVPLSDGKQPLFMWLASISLRLVPDPLLAGRLVSVLAGLGEMVAIYWLSKIIFDKKTAIWSAVLYLLIPFFLFFNRLALVDSLLSFSISVSFLAGIKLAETNHYKWAFLLGISMGMGWLTKSPGEIFLILVPLSSLLWYLKQQATFSVKILKKSEFWFFAGYLILSMAMALAIYSILRFAPVFYMISRRNKDYLWGWSALWQHPLDPLLPHLRDTWRYYNHYLTRPILLAASIGLICLLKQRRWMLISILAIWWLPVIPMAAMAKVFTARYILYSAIPLLLLASIGLSWLSKLGRWALLLMVSIILVSLLHFDGPLWFQPWKTPLPADEYKGYLSDWTAGEGIRQIAEYLRQRPVEERIVVATEGFFGTLPNGLQIYFDKSNRITVIGGPVETNKIPGTLINARRAGDKAYLVVNASRFKMKNTRGLKLINRYSKPGGDALLFWEVTTNVQKI